MSILRPSSSPRAAASTDCPSFAPGNFPGCQRTYDTRLLILPRKVRPSGSGTSTMSRGIDAMETVFATGSSDATIIVSVSAVLRPTPESMPISRTFTRGIAGVGDGDGEAEARQTVERSPTERLDAEVRVVRRDGRRRTRPGPTPRPR